MSIEVGQRFHWEHGSIIEVDKIDHNGVHATVVEKGVWTSPELKDYIVRPVGEQLLFVDGSEIQLGDPI